MVKLYDGGVWLVNGTELVAVSYTHLPGGLFFSSLFNDLYFQIIKIQHFDKIIDVYKRQITAWNVTRSSSLWRKRRKRVP